MPALHEILDKVGLGSGRLEMFNLSAGMGGRFAEIVREMDERVRGLKAGADVKFFVDHLKEGSFPPIYHFARNGQDLYRSLNGRHQPVGARRMRTCHPR